MKAAKPHLKQLQQQVKVFSSEREPLNDQSGHSPQSPDSFQWITKEQTLVMVYLVRSNTCTQIKMYTIMLQCITKGVVLVRMQLAM